MTALLQTRWNTLTFLSLLVLVAGTAALVSVDPDGPAFLGGFVAAWVAAAQAPPREAARLTAGTLAVLAIACVVGVDRPLMSAALGLLGVAAFHRLGSYARRLQERIRESEALLAELQETRAAQLAAATLGERHRLAREMHDVLAHSLSGLTLHLEGARLLAQQTPDIPARLADAITRAHHLAETGLHEARQAIDTLRAEELPGPERLPILVAEFERDTGVPCELAVIGETGELDAQTRLTVYRVAQEALTNVRKHAKARRVDVRLEYRTDDVQLTVEDHGEAPQTSSNGTGYGLSGMRERAELLEGTLHAEATDSGFLVSLRVPRTAEVTV